MNLRPEATPYNMDWLFFAALADPPVLPDPLLALVPEVVPAVEAELEPEPETAPPPLDFEDDAEVDALPAFAFVVPDFRTYDGILAVFFFVFMTFCAVMAISLA